MTWSQGIPWLDLTQAILSFSESQLFSHLQNEKEYLGI